MKSLWKEAITAQYDKSKIKGSDIATRFTRDKEDFRAKLGFPATDAGFAV